MAAVAPGAKSGARESRRSRGRARLYVAERWRRRQQGPVFLADSQLQPEVMALVQEVPHLRAQVARFRAEEVSARLGKLLADGAHRSSEGGRGDG